MQLHIPNHTKIALLLTIMIKSWTQKNNKLDFKTKYLNRILEPAQTFAAFSIDKQSRFSESCSLELLHQSLLCSYSQNMEVYRIGWMASCPTRLLWLMLMWQVPKCHLLAHLVLANARNQFYNFVNSSLFPKCVGINIIWLKLLYITSIKSLNIA